MHSPIFCGHSVTNMYKLSVIVIDKPIELGGTAYTWALIFMSHQCTMYHQNKRFETKYDVVILLYCVTLTLNISLTLTVPVMTIDALRHFETG